MIDLTQSTLNLYDFHPLTIDRWPDFEKLFGASGAYGGCWCMWWFEPGSEFERMKGEPNRLAMQERVKAGEPPGILAYLQGEPVGWCAFGPRAAYPRLRSARLLKAIDDQPVWSVVCFYVKRAQRRKGLTTALLLAVIEAVRQQGGRIVEGYPYLPKPGGHADPFAYPGLAPAFLRAGFVEVARPSERRMIVRFAISPAAGEEHGE
jgi:GNAT superfamily N-acetyltransferase